MGYYIQMIQSSFCIPKANLDLFWERATLLMSDDTIDLNGSGGTFKDGKKSESWYSWVNTDATRKAILNRDIRDFFGQWGYSVELGDKDSQFEVVDIMHSTGDTYKIGDEDRLFAAIAPAVNDGSFIDMKGEQQEEWRWAFDFGRIHSLDVVDKQITFANADKSNEIVF